MALEAFHDDDQPKVEKKESVKKDKEQKTEKKEQVTSKETPIDQQKFIENKFVRLDSVFRWAGNNIKYEKNNATAPIVLDTKRWNVSFHIEKDWGGGKNAEVTVKDEKGTTKLLLEYPESTLKYQMSVLQNGKALSKKDANAAATKYIGML